MKVTAKSRYEALKPLREQFLDRARRCAELSLPSILPPEGFTNSRGSSQLPEPYQGLGARAVVNLSSRLLLALLPPGQKFFRLGVPTETLVAAGEDGEPAEITNGLAKVEKLIQGEVERQGWRQPTNMSLQLLTATGNSLEWTGDDNKIRVWRLDQYVVARDSSGQVIELVIEQAMHPSRLTPEGQKVTKARADDVEAEVLLYTWVKRIGSKYAVRQEVDDIVIPGTEGVYDRLPFRVLRWNSVPDEDYGRGKIEEHLSDFNALERLTKSMLEGAEMASRNVIRISGGAMNAKQLERKVRTLKNGDIVIAEPGELEMLQFTNIGGLQVVAAEIARLEQNLSRAFLMTSSIQRDAERVTAYEISLMAEELEGTLGGVYSMLSEDMQRDRVISLIENMQRNNQLPMFDEEMAEPTITTGLEALGRNQEVARVMQAFNVAPSLPEDAIAEWDWNHLGKTFMTGIDLPRAILSPEESAKRRREREVQAAAMAGAAQPQM